MVVRTSSERKPAAIDSVLIRVLKLVFYSLKPWTSH